MVFDLLRIFYEIFSFEIFFNWLHKFRDTVLLCRLVLWGVASLRGKVSMARFSSCWLLVNVCSVGIFLAQSITKLRYSLSFTLDCETALYESQVPSVVLKTVPFLIKGGFRISDLFSFIKFLGIKKRCPLEI